MEPLPPDAQRPEQPGPSLLTARVPWYVSVPLVAAMLALVLWNGGVLRGRSEAAKTAAANADVATLSGMIEAFRADAGRYPSTAEGLGALLDPPPGLAGWRGPYLKRLPNDPWGIPFVYHTSAGGASYQLRSAGPDQEAGTADDVVASGPAAAAGTVSGTAASRPAAPPRSSLERKS